MNIIKTDHLLSNDYKHPALLWLPQTSTEKVRALTGTRIMALSIQNFLQVELLLCVLTTSMGSIINLEKALSQLENKVNVQQEEIKSLHHLVEQLEKRLEPLEEKGDFH